MGGGSGQTGPLTPENMSLPREVRVSEPEALQSAGRILDILLCFTPQRREWSVAELSAELGIHKSIVRRCVITLVSRGFLKQNPEDRRFRLGYAVFDLGALVLPGEEIRRVATPVMQELSRLTSTSVFLTMEEDGQAVCIGRVDSPGPLKVTFEVGRRSPLHAGASARVLLAHMPPEEVDRVIRNGLTRFTENTFVSGDLLLEELALTRQRGYALSFGELDPGVAALGVAVRGRIGEVVASLSVSGPSSDFTPGRIPELVEMTRRSAEAITGALFGGPAQIGDRNRTAQRFEKGGSHLCPK
jgi:DNA-binding IclR family transcriptional regulator